MKSKIMAIFGILSLISIFIMGCAKPAEKPAEEFQEVIDTGVLIVESSPSEAQVYVDGELKGQTPLTLYNFPAGTYDIAVKKNDYFDFEKTVNVKVGLTEEVDAKLTAAKAQAEAKPEEKPEERMHAQSNKINLSSFAMYHDFENKLFTELRGEKSDVFSRKYDAYVDFVALTPAKIEIIGKPLKEISRIDCINTDGGIAQLHSQESLCVITMEGSYFAVSGSWQASPSELDFVELS